ncbi:MAG: hypothetical protein WHX60_08525 [Armatimonadota bacterium]
MAFTAYPQSVVSTHSSLAGGSAATGDPLTPERENCKVQVSAGGSQTFQLWLECQYDGTNWVTLWTGASTAAGTGSASANVATSPVVAVVPGRPVRAGIRNTAGSAGDFITAVVAWQV